MINDTNSIFITGLTGQVGSQLADYVLANTTLNVVGFLRWQEPLDNIEHLLGHVNKGERVYLEYGDLCDITSLQRALIKWKPNFVSHLAAQSFPKTSFDSPIETLSTNVLGTANLLEAIRLTWPSTEEGPVIHVCSSSEVYGKAKAGLQISESTPFHGASPYSISKIGTDFLGQFYGEAYGMKTFVTRMGTHSGPRRSDVFFESTVAKQIAMIEAGLQEPILKVGNLSSVRTFQDTRDAVRAYMLLIQAADEGRVPPGEAFNIAGNEVFKLTEVVDILISKAKVAGIQIQTDPGRLRPIDADYQMFDNTKIRAQIDWAPEISVERMLEDLLNHWRDRISKGFVPLDR
jgi:GDPmannose 4,6-dehydratase